MIRFVCECGAQLQAREEDAGKAVICPSCNRQLTAPAETPPSEGVQRERPIRRYEQGPDEGQEIDDRLRRQPTGNSGKAVASLVLGILSLFCNVLAGLPALILGVLALRDIGRSRGRLSGQGLAIAGIVTACVLTFFSCILLLPALLLPAVQRVREAAHRAASQNKLRQIAFAMHNYRDTNRGLFPAAAICDEHGKPLLSWRVAILPYIEQENLYNQFKLDEPWDGPHNKLLAERLVQTYMLPGDDKTKTPLYYTHYQVFVGKGAAFDKTRGHSIQDFRDGLSNTILIVVADKAVPWTKPEDVDFDPNKPMLPLMGRHFRGGFNVALADGSVRLVAAQISENTLKAAITRNGGDALGPDW